eukprot:s1543_g6.t1
MSRDKSWVVLVVVVLVLVLVLVATGEGRVVELVPVMCFGRFQRTLPENVEIAYEQMRMQLTVLEPGSESTETVIVVHL